MKNNNQPRNPVSEETIMSLCQNMRNNFNVYFSTLSDSIQTSKNLDEIDTEKLSEREKNLLFFWKELLRLHIYTALLNLDISAILQANFRSKSGAEKRSNLKFVNVITLEGYRYLFGSKGDKTNAVWNQFRQSAELLGETELMTDIDNIEFKAKEFKNKYAQKIDRTNRNLAIHYDSNPFKVYLYLEQITDEDYECKRVCSFYSYLELISCLINKWILRLKIPLIYVKSEISTSINDIIVTLNDKDDKMFNVLGDSLSTYPIVIDKLMRQCRVFEKMISTIQNEIDLGNIFNEMIESLYPGIHIAYLYIDIASTTRAYLKSEYYIEKLLNLRRINVIVYEGFKKLYGFNENQQEKSFWNKHIYPLLKNSDNEAQIKALKNMELELIKISRDPIINDCDLRECSVHYRYEDSDNLISLFGKLMKFNMMSELIKAKLLLDILPKLLEISTKAVQYKKIEESKKAEQQRNDIIAKLDGAIEMITNQPSCTQEYKDKFAEMKEKVNALFCKFDTKI